VELIQGLVGGSPMRGACVVALGGAEGSSSPASNGQSCSCGEALSAPGVVALVTVAQVLKESHAMS
jgi:hypothetical protein